MAKPKSKALRQRPNGQAVALSDPWSSPLEAALKQLSKEPNEQEQLEWLDKQIKHEKEQLRQCEAQVGQVNDHINQLNAKRTELVAQVQRKLNHKP